MEENIDIPIPYWKDYLNLNPVNYDFLYVTGNLLNIREAEPKSIDEMEEEKFIVKTLPVNAFSLDGCMLEDCQS